MGGRNLIRMSKKNIIINIELEKENMNIVADKIQVILDKLWEKELIKDFEFYNKWEDNA